MKMQITTLLVLLSLFVASASSADQRALRSATKSKFFSGNWVADLEQTEDCSYANCPVAYTSPRLVENYSVKMKMKFKGYTPTFVGGATLWSHTHGKIEKLKKFTNIFSNTSAVMTRRFERQLVDGLCVEPVETLILSVELIAQKTAHVVHRVEFFQCGSASHSYFYNEYQGLAYKVK